MNEREEDIPINPDTEWSWLEWLFIICLIGGGVFLFIKEVVLEEMM